MVLGSNLGVSPRGSVDGSSNGYPDGYPGGRVAAVCPGPMARKQRRKGTGAIYQNTRGQWVAAIEVGWTERGTRRRLTLKAQTEKEVRARLAEAQRRLAVEGPVTSFASITVKRWVDTWLPERQRVVRPGTYVSDRSAVDRWIVPTIGHLRLDALVPADIRKVAAAQESAGLGAADDAAHARSAWETPH